MKRCLAFWTQNDVQTITKSWPLLTLSYVCLRYAACLIPSSISFTCLEFTQFEGFF